MCIKNHNHMMYASWDMECDRQNFLSFWVIFCSFTQLTLVHHKWQSCDVCPFCPFNPPSLTTWKIKILKKWKKVYKDIIILHMCTINENHMMYGSWDTGCNRHDFSRFEPFLPFHPLNNLENVYQKSWSYDVYTSWDIIILHKCTKIMVIWSWSLYQKSWSDDVWFLRYGAPQMGIRTEVKSDM